MLTFSTPARMEPLDRRGYFRSYVTQPSYRLGKPPANKGRKFPIELPTAEEVYAMLDACGRGPAGRRNRALLMTLWRAGLRINEALSLMPKDVDLERGRITVLHGKGDKRRIVPLDPAAAAVLERWGRERRKLRLDGRHPMFCVISKPTKGMPLHDAYVRGLVKQLAERAGIEKRISPHTFRHAYASYLADIGMPLHFIQGALGHASLQVTERYISHLNPAELVERLREVEWPAPPE